MTYKHLLVLFISTAFLFSCVSKKKLQAEKDRYVLLETERNKLQGDLRNCTDLTAENERKRASLQGEIDNLTKQISFLKENNTQA